jgi:hypothetical protein
VREWAICEETQTTIQVLRQLAESIGP